MALELPRYAPNDGADVKGRNGDAFSSPAPSSSFDARPSLNNNNEKETMHYSYVGCGAIVGVVARYYLTKAHRRVLNVDGDDNVIVHSILANIVACFILGAAKGTILPKHWSAFIGTGFCGAMSTFSTFMEELAIIVLLRGTWGLLTALFAIVIALGSCYSAYALGLAIGKKKQVAGGW